MKNSEYLTLCKVNEIKDPQVVGFYFPVPIPSFEQDHEPIYSCCYLCAEMAYFGMEQIDEESYEEDPEYYQIARFTEEQIDSAVMITFTDPEQISFVFQDGFPCFVCDSVAVY